MNPAILVGRRPDGGPRDRLWAFCRSRWTEQLGWPIHEGFHLADERPEFCLSVASNRAAHAARMTGADVFVYVGGDWIAQTATQVETACALALSSGQLAFAHNETVVLTEAATAALVAGPAAGPVGEHAEGSVHSNTFSGVLAVTRTLWDEVGGFDERFVGWGFDDLAFLDACWGAAGGFDRVPGRIYHLWHPQDRSLREEQPFHGKNQVLWERYREARGSRFAMENLLSEPGGSRDQ